MIYYSIPWDTGKNIGRYYNSFMKMLPNDDDYACFIDGDAMFLVNDFGKQLEEIVAKYPECGVFTCMTNRIGCKWQAVPLPVDHATVENNIDFHRKLASLFQEEDRTSIKDVSNVPRGQVMGGVLILLRKSVWQKIGGFKEDGMLGIDNDLHWKCMDNNEKVYLMEGVYIYHWYRWPDGDKSHLT